MFNVFNKTPELFWNCHTTYVIWGDPIPFRGDHQRNLAENHPGVNWADFERKFFFT